MAQITQIQIDFNKRFLYCLQELKALNIISSMKEIIQEAGLSPQRYTELDRGFRQQRQDSRYKTVEIEIIYLLVSKYNINPYWLILGVGDMFAKQ